MRSGRTILGGTVWSLTKLWGGIICMEIIGLELSGLELSGMELSGVELFRVELSRVELFGLRQNSRVELFVWK